MTNKCPYDKFNDIIKKISDDIDSGQTEPAEFIDKVKCHLQDDKDLSEVYQEWKKSKFNVNFRFKLLSYNEVVEETTLLNVAIQCNRVEICVPLIRYLLANGADPNLEAVYMFHNAKTTNLHIACSTFGGEVFNLGIIELLLKNRANVNAKDGSTCNTKGETVLHQVVKKSFKVLGELPEEQIFELIKLLIKYGANVYAEDKSDNTPLNLTGSRFRDDVINEKLVISIQKFLEEQKYSVEYHRKLYELVEQNKDLELLASIIEGSGLINVRGIQVCSQAIPKMLGIPDIKITIKDTAVDIGQEFSQEEGYPVIHVEGDSLRYYDLFKEIIDTFPENPTIKSLFDRKSGESLGYEVSQYIRENSTVINQKLWGIIQTPKEENNTTKMHVEQTEGKNIPNALKEQNLIPQTFQENESTTEGKGTKDDTNRKRTRDEAAVSENTKPHSTINHNIYLQKETKNPPIFSTKQKIAIVICVVAALATALACYSVQIPALTTVISALIVGVGAYLVSSKLYDVTCNGASQQPGF